MTNNVSEPNPFGRASPEELERFEKELGVLLPEDYRKYLIDFNGGRYVNDIVRISDDEGETRVHHWFGLHSGPEFNRLYDNQSELESYQREYLAVSDDASGNLFVIKLTGTFRGAVYFLDHEMPLNECLFVQVGKSFNEFVDKMKSQKETMDEFKARDPEGYDEFQRRLEMFKRMNEAGE